MDLSDFIRTPRCDCCAHIYDGRDRNAPADYIWTCALSGNEVPLCASCCAGWRLNAEADPGLAPSRIRQVERAQIFVAPVGTGPDEPGAWTHVGEVA